MRLPSFPAPEPGETVASVVARHLYRTAGPRSRSLSILGLQGNAANSLVPLQVRTLADSMPAGHPWQSRPDEIVKHHTLVPLYLHFARPERSAALLEAIVAGSTGNPAASLGLAVTSSRRLTSRHKFCSECVDSDIRTLGFSVLYREHQASFVRVCVRHEKPLLFSCSQCHSQRKALKMWSMAGRCDCESPQLHFANRLSGDSTYQAGALFLAWQAKVMLANPFPTVPLAELLRMTLINAGFSGRTGIDAHAIHWALIARYGTLLLQDLGIIDAARTNSVSIWPRRLFSSNVIKGDNTPDVLRCILVAGLVVDNISKLYAIPSKRENAENACPSGYGKIGPLKREMLTTQTIASALKDSGYRISTAAERLGVTSSRLAVDMLRQGMNLPLSPATAKRLGPKLTLTVTQALQSGLPKIQIQRTFGISEWSLQLIELASPELRETHREATIEMQRESHRSSVLLQLKLHPSSKRSDIIAHCVAACDWLRRFDGEWLERHLPKPRRGTSSSRSPRKDWHKFDLDAVDAICAEMQYELNKSGRPTRITISRLLRAGGALNKHPSLVPRAIVEAKRCAESEDAYLRRRIKWAVQAYANQHIAISMNQLRRVAALSPERLLLYRDFIQEMAQRNQITIDARCVFSPQHD